MIVYMINYMMNSVMILFLMLILVMISVAFFTLFERKIMGKFHFRKAPNKMLMIGISQPFNDAMKLLTKEFFSPNKINFYFYLSSPMIMLILSLLIWLIYPIYSNLMKMNNSLLLFLCLISVGVYGLIISGWASNSLFSLIGSIRSIAQSISYEVTFSISILLLLLLLNSMNLMKISYFYKNYFLILMNLPLIMLIFCSMIAEINRTPFDLSEGESELISGFNIEYSSGNFTLIFLAEYSKLMFMMMLFNLMFLSNNSMNFSFYWLIIMMIYFITWIRMTLPRMRYDKLMSFCWLYLLPLNLNLFLIYLLFKFYMDLMYLFN